MSFPEWMTNVALFLGGKSYPLPKKGEVCHSFIEKSEEVDQENKAKDNDDDKSHDIDEVKEMDANIKEKCKEESKELSLKPSPKKLICKKSFGRSLPPKTFLRSSEMDISDKVMKGSEMKSKLRKSASLNRKQNMVSKSRQGSAGNNIRVKKLTNSPRKDLNKSSANIGNGLKWLPAGH